MGNDFGRKLSPRVLTKIIYVVPHFPRGEKHCTWIGWVSEKSSVKLIRKSEIVFDHINMKIK